MKIDDFGAILADLVSNSPRFLPDETPLAHAAAECRQMAAAYQSDGIRFLALGDPVNALASFAYGLGWIDAAVHMGFVSSSPLHRPSPVEDAIPDPLLPHLIEKTARYARLLTTACGAVQEAPDPASVFYAGAARCVEEAIGAMQRGVAAHEGGDDATALAEYSYGFAWLDAGVRIGLLRVLASREIFTI